MPQMKPMMWMFLYKFFLSLMIIFNMFNYYIFINKPKMMILNAKNFFKKKLSCLWIW